MKNSFLIQSKCVVGIALCLSGVAYSARVVTNITPIIVSDPGTGGFVEFNLNPGLEATGDAVNDVSLAVDDFGGNFSFLTAAGLSSTTIVVQGPNDPENTAALLLGVGVSVGPTNDFGGSATDFGGAELASEDGSTGDWAGGTTGYLGFEFDISGDTHYGFARVTWSPDPAGASFATIDQVGYETSPSIAVVTVPEPSTMFLSALASIALIRRRRN